MPKRKADRYQDLTRAVIDGTVDDVRQILATGMDPDAREEADDPTPLMVAAARGRLDLVEVLVTAGADANARIDDQSDELEQFPFLDELYASAELHGLFPLAYAGLYNQQQVYDYLVPKTASHLCSQAEVIQRAKATHPSAKLRPYGEPAKPKAASQAAREELLAKNPKIRRWVNACVLCGRQGYKPELPDEIDDKGSAQQLRRLFASLTLVEKIMCNKCAEKVNKGRQKIEARRRQREGR